MRPLAAFASAPLYCCSPPLRMSITPALLWLVPLTRSRSPAPLRNWPVLSLATAAFSVPLPVTRPWLVKLPVTLRLPGRTVPRFTTLPATAPSPASVPVPCTVNSPDTLSGAPFCSACVGRPALPAALPAGLPRLRFFAAASAPTVMVCVPMPLMMASTNLLGRKFCSQRARLAKLPSPPNCHATLPMGVSNTARVWPPINAVPATCPLLLIPRATVMMAPLPGANMVLMSTMLPEPQ